MSASDEVRKMVDKHGVHLDYSTPERIENAKPAVTLNAAEEKLSGLEAAAKGLAKICGIFQLSWSLEFSEAEGLYYAYASGQGDGEQWEIKKASSAPAALRYLREAIYEAGRSREINTK